MKKIDIYTLSPGVSFQDLTRIDQQIEYLLKHIFDDLDKTVVVDKDMYIKLGVQWSDPLTGKGEKQKALVDRAFYHVHTNSLTSSLEKDHYRLSLSAIRILENGGWLKFRQDHEQRERSQQEMTNSVIRTNQNQRWTMWITLCVAVFTCYLQFEDKEEKRAINDMRQEFQQLKIELKNQSTKKEYFKTPIQKRDTTKIPKR